MNDKCSAKKLPYQTFFQLFLLLNNFANQSLLLSASKLDYSQKYMSFYYIINNLTTSESLSEKKRGY